METATQELHRLTSYSPDRDWDEPPDDPRARHDFQPNDYATLPLFYKRFASGLPRLALPRELPVTTAPALPVLSGTGLPGTGQAGTGLTVTGRVDLPALARLLYWSAGIVRTSPRATYTHLFRAAGSAGGRFPLDIYVAVPAGYPGLPEGVHCYDPLEHALVTIGPAPSAGAPTIIVTGIPWRTGWRYGERGYRHVYWDAGTMLAQTLALADSAGIAPRLYTRFPDAEVAALVGADQVHEWPVAVIALGAGTPVTGAVRPAAPGQTDTAPLEFPLVTAAQRAGDGDTLGEPWDPGAAVDVPVAGRSGPTAPAGMPSVDAVIAARGSQRLMDPDRGLPLATLSVSMSVATRGIDVPHWVAVHAVTGLAPGLYRWPDLTTPARDGNLRDELYRVALDQGLARDAAFVVIAATDVSRLSDREYREAQLAAGLVEGRLHLAAYALGASATGMTFLDSEIPALLGSREFPDGLIFTCVGVPEYTAKQAGSPGAPTSIGRVTERNG